MDILCDGYTIHYTGGRLADVLIGGHAVEAVPVRSEDGQHGRFTEAEPLEAEVCERVADWLNPEDMANYRESARASADAERQHEQACTDPRCMCGKRRT